MGDEFKTFLEVLLAIAGGIVVIGGAMGIIEHLAEKVSIRQNRVAQQVAEHEDVLEKHTLYLDNDNKRLKSVEDTNRLIMRGVMQLMSHEIDGNHTSQLQETRDDMQKYLINR